MALTDIPCATSQAGCGSPEGAACGVLLAGFFFAECLMWRTPAVPLPSAALNSSSTQQDALQGFHTYISKAHEVRALGGYSNMTRATSIVSSLDRCFTRPTQPGQILRKHQQTRLLSSRYSCSSATFRRAAHQRLLGATDSVVTRKNVQAGHSAPVRRRDKVQCGQITLPAKF